MKKSIMLLTLSTAAPLTRGAAFAPDALPAPSTSSTLSLLSSDDQIVQMRSDLSAKYIGYIAEVLDLQKQMPGIIEDLSENPIDLKESGLSGRALRLLVALAQSADIIEKNTGKISATSVAQSMWTPPPPFSAVKELLNEADTLRLNPLITDALAAIAVRKHGRYLNQFKELPSTAKSAIAKQFSLTHLASSIPEEWTEKGNADIAYGVSIQDLLDQDEEFPIQLGRLGLNEKKINDLTGLNRIPGIEHVTGIWFNGNRLQAIPPKAFKGLENLSLLLLTKNRIETIAPGAFAELGNLQSLKLDSNNIRDIVPGAFIGLNNLSQLDLSDNKIETITTGTFEGLNNLAVLNLYTNPLQIINEGAFAGLNKLQQILLPKRLTTDPAKQARIEANIRATSPKARIYFVEDSWTNQ